MYRNKLSQKMKLYTWTVDIRRQFKNTTWYCLSWCFKSELSKKRSSGRTECLSDRESLGENVFWGMLHRSICFALWSSLYTVGSSFFLKRALSSCVFDRSDASSYAFSKHLLKMEYIVHVLPKSNWHNCSIFQAILFLHSLISPYFTLSLFETRDWLANCISLVKT